MVFPVVLGSGRRLFEEGTAVTRFALVAVDQVGPEGITIMTYRPLGH